MRSSSPVNLTTYRQKTLLLKDKLPKLTQGETHTLNIPPILLKKLNFLLKIFPQRKFQTQTGLQVSSFTLSRRSEVNFTFYKFLQRMKENIPNSFHETKIFLISKSENNNIRKENLNSSSLINL